MLRCNGRTLNIDSLWSAVLIIGQATAAYQGFSANLFALPSDIFPREAVGSVVGIGGAAGAIGGMIMSKYAGWVLERLGTYTPNFHRRGQRLPGGVAGDSSVVTAAGSRTYGLMNAPGRFLHPRQFFV